MPHSTRIVAVISETEVNELGAQSGLRHRLQSHGLLKMSLCRQLL